MTIAAAREETKRAPQLLGHTVVVMEILDAAPSALHCRGIIARRAMFARQWE
jgi:hypothetical protein